MSVRARSLVLVGPRAAGKTTLGRALAEALGWSFADTDDAIAARVGRPAGEFLAEVGEPQFRAVEAEVVRAALGANEDRVLALGGGAILDAESRDELTRESHFVVFVWATPPVLAERQKGGPLRPALTDRAPLAEVSHLLAVREPLYRAVCDVALDTSKANVPACCAVVLARMEAGAG